MGQILACRCGQTGTEPESVIDVPQNVELKIKPELTEVTDDVSQIETKESIDLPKPESIDLPKPESIDLPKPESIDLPKPESIDLPKPEMKMNAHDKLAHDLLAIGHCTDVECEHGHPMEGRYTQCVINNIYDGDTADIFYIRDNVPVPFIEIERARFAGYDAPEMKPKRSNSQSERDDESAAARKARRMVIAFRKALCRENIWKGEVRAIIV
jgi:hypothetical protein